MNYGPALGRNSATRSFICAGWDSQSVPISETREIDDPRYAFLARPMAIRPNWPDFKIDGKPLFPECTDYLTRAQTLINEARAIADKVHVNNPPTFPPL